MDKNKFENLKKELIKNKKVGLISSLLILILVALSMSYFNDLSNISKSKEDNFLNSKQDTAIASDINHEYEKAEKEELEKILSSIEGVGDVEVKLSFSGSEIKVPAKDKNVQINETEETDSEGGERLNKETTDDDKVVMKNDDDGNSPYILETKKPEVIGIMVVAQGAENSKIKYEISKAIASLYDISLDDVNIFPMEK